MNANIIFVSSPVDLLAPILTIVTIWIAYNQYKTGKDKLRLDFFNRRYSVYIKLTECFTRILINCRVTEQDVYTINSIKEEAYFLFDKDINTFLNECYTKLYKSHHYQKAQLLKVQLPNKPADIDPLSSMKEYQRLQENADLFIWIGAQSEELKNIFKPYLYNKKYVRLQAK
jgi:hypothetical protein